MTVEIAEKFDDLPLDQQRAVIDWCIEKRAYSMPNGNITYHLPNLLQITYKCSKCSEIHVARFFNTTVINNHVQRFIYCNARTKNKRCGGKMYIIYKSIVLDYYIGKKKKPNIKGLMRYLNPLMEEEKEELFTPGGDIDE